MAIPARTSGTLSRFLIYVSSATPASSPLPPIFDSLSELDHDHLIWCTGFRPALSPFRHLMRGRETAMTNLHLVGYGNWTGDASATLMGGSPLPNTLPR